MSTEAILTAIKNQVFYCGSEMNKEAFSEAFDKFIKYGDDADCLMAASIYAARRIDHSVETYVEDLWAENVVTWFLKAIYKEVKFSNVFGVTDLLLLAYGWKARTPMGKALVVLFATKARTLGANKPEIDKMYAEYDQELL